MSGDIYLKPVRVTQMDIMTDGQFTDDYLTFIRERAKRYPDYFACFHLQQPIVEDSRQPDEPGTSEVHPED